MATLLPTDADNNPIPAVRFKNGGAHALASGAGSVRNDTAFDGATRVVSLYATEDVYINFGDSNVTASASDHFFPKNTYYDVAIGGDRTVQSTHIAALQVSAAGTLYVSEKE